MAGFETTTASNLECVIETTTASNLECVNDLEWKPKCDMEFDSKQSAYDFYNMYGGKVGFSIRREGFGKNRSTGELTSRKFVCSKEGFRSNDKRDILTTKPRAETRTGCNAQLCIKLNRVKKNFFVTHFVEYHNHPLVMQKCTHMLPSQRKMANSQTIEVDLAEESEIPLKSSYELLGRQVGGREFLGYTKQDQKNYIRSKRQMKLAFGEAGCVLKYFSDQSLKNPSFFQSVQLDNEEQIMNMFWADARMIIDYGQFGDVVSFDTTYKINKANRPFAVFVGLNHHRETVIFGAALMYDETIDSFIWLFETFLKAMSGKAPKTMFTDQDAAMAKALSHVMPNTYHRLCTWHIMQNALKHVHGAFMGPGGVKNVLSKFMNEIEEQNEFLMAWNKILDDYDMHENSWMKSIFAIKEKWAHAYVRHEWSAGMNTTQLSESFNASLKDYLKSDLNIAQFFIHFERVVNDKRYKELEAEYNLCYRLVDIKVPAKMLTQAREFYTKAIFEEFQAQFLEAIEMSLESCADDDGSLFHVVTKDESFKKWHVKRKSDNLLSCSCRMFEMKGVICSHVIKVLREAMNVKDIPDQYILKRWTKQARAECVQDMHGHEIQADPKLQQTYQYRSLCSIFTRISSRASESEKAYNVAHEHASNLARLVEDILRLETAGNKTGHESQDVNLEVNSIQDSNLMKAKGLKKKESSRGRRRIKSSLEKALAKRKKSSKSLTHSQTFETSTHLLPMISNGLNPSMVYAPHSPTSQLQAYNMHNLFSWTPNEQVHTMKLQELTPNEQAQTIKQQELVQQNEATASLVFKDSQASTSFSLI